VPVSLAPLWPETICNRIKRAESAFLAVVAPVHGASTSWIFVNAAMDRESFYGIAADTSVELALSVPLPSTDRTT
jgi:hypothetical protein